MVLTAAGRLLVANSFLGLRFTDDFCTWTRAEGVDDLLVADVTTRGDSVVVLTSTGTGSGIDNRLWTSADAGAHLVPSTSDLPDDVVITSVAFAPSRPERVYALGLVVASSEGALLRSDDGGRTFRRFSAPSTVAPRAALRLAAVHPFDPDIVFAHIDVEATSSEDFDELWVTSNGGESWRRVFAGQGDLPGFSLSPDALQVAFAGPRDGVYRGLVSAIVGGDARALVQVNPRATWGLLWNARGLYGGNDDFGFRDASEPYTLGLSHDEGATFEEVADICAFRFSACADGTPGRDLCHEVWSGPEPRDFTDTFQIASGRCVVDAGALPPPPPSSDGGGPSQPDAPSGEGGAPAGSAPEGGDTSAPEHVRGGCGCRLEPSGGHAPGWLMLVGVTLGLTRRRRMS
jgi:MYXO-CTERM domain-containing protein